MCPYKTWYIDHKYTFNIHVCRPPYDIGAIFIDNIHDISVIFATNAVVEWIKSSVSTLWIWRSGFWIKSSLKTMAVIARIKYSLYIRLNAGRLGVQIPGRGKCSLRTTEVVTQLKYPPNILFCIFADDIHDIGVLHMRVHPFLLPENPSQDAGAGHQQPHRFWPRPQRHPHHLLGAR